MPTSRRLLGRSIVSALALASVLGLAAPASAEEIPPTSVIEGPATGLAQPYGVTVDPDGYVYVSNTGAGTVTVFAPGASGDAAPARVIAGPATGLTGPLSTIIAANGEIIVSNALNTPTGPSIRVFAPGASGDAAPIRVIQGPAAQLGTPYQAALDAAGNLYVATVDSRIVVFAPDAAGDVAPIRTIAGPATGIQSAYGVAVAPDGETYVSSFRNPGRISVFATGANGDVAPVRTISGPATGLNNPLGLVLSRGSLYVANYSTVAPVAVFDASASGDVAPLRTIGGTATTLARATQAAVASNGTILVVEPNVARVVLFAPRISVTSVAPATGREGTTIILTGTGFTADATVTVGGNAATGVVVVDGTTLTAVVPAGTPGLVDVVVSTVEGSATAADSFTYLAAPVTPVTPATPAVAAAPAQLAATGVDLTPSLGAAALLLLAGIALARRRTATRS